MAEKTEFLQAIDDAILDADSLEQFINGDDTQTVLTRLSKRYPSLQKAIKQMFENGGLPAVPFKTKAEMEASNLTDGSYAVVTDDTVNTGLYVKTGSSWNKSEYDPKGAVLEKIEKLISTDNTSDLFRLVDSDNVQVARVDFKGDIYSTSFYGSLRDNINKTDDTSDVFRFLDSNNVPLLRMMQNGELRLLGERVVTESELESDTKGHSIEPLVSLSEIALDNERLRLKDTEPLRKQERIINAADNNAVQTMTPSITRIAEDKFYLVTTDGGVGDFAIAAIYGYTITVDKANNYALSISSPVLIVQDGTDAEGDWAAAGGAVLYVREGNHAGRLYVYYIKRYGTRKDVMMYVYSDNMGQTWSDPVSMEQFYPQDGNYRILVPSPAEMIQVTQGKYKGRILIPAWRGDTTYPASQVSLKALIMYSDDGGETYHIGAESSVHGSNESAIAQVNGDVFAYITRDPSNYKWIEYSYDGGLTLENPRKVEEIRTQKVQSGFIQTKNDYDFSPNRLVVTGPHGAPNWDQDKDFRDLQDLAMHISYDGGRTFPVHKVIANGWTRYSVIGVIDEQTLLVVYVTGIDKDSMDAVTINLKEVLIGE